MAASCALGQAGTAAEAKPAPAASKVVAYDVVTVRPNKSGAGNWSVDENLNVLTATNVLLINLLQEAYDLQPNLISGGPKWMESARFDVRAKIVDADAEALEKMTGAEKRGLLRRLLAEQFQLQVHRETRTLPVYELVVAKGGSKLVEVPVTDKAKPLNGVSSGSMTMHDGSLTGHDLRVEWFAKALTSQVQRTVVDKTGLTGKYDFQMKWTRDDAPAADDSGAPPIFKALEEQLGLKLVATKAPVEVLVVDRAEMPAEN